MLTIGYSYPDNPAVHSRESIEEKTKELIEPN
jgi:hypothetical protein